MDCYLYIYIYLRLRLFSEWCLQQCLVSRLRMQIAVGFAKELRRAFQCLVTRRGCQQMCLLRAEYKGWDGEN